jgi:YebC/PmpR family DNA-binding regulatory protein
MSGHSKWSTIKRKKGKADAERGRLFTKLIKEITVAARMGGGDETSNSRLRSVVATAKAANMPADNIKKAIQKGTGELPGVTYEEVTYEGYGPGGVAVMVQTLTDNKNRTVAEVRHWFTKRAGNLGETGCVSWMFDKQGMIRIETDKIEEDSLLEIVLEAGATDVITADDSYEISTTPDAFEQVRSALEAKGIEMAEAEIAMVPQNTVKLEGKQAEQMIRLYEELDELDDVQHVYANFDIDDELLEQLSG